jgi:membrane protease YdiL (CAAX protease family)
MTIIYRILSLIINFIAALLAVSLLFSIPMLLSSPITMLSAFMMIAVILYSWFSFQFRKHVLQQHQTVRHSLRDWVRVNGIVTLVFSFMTIISVLPLLQNSQSFTDALKGMGFEMPLKSVTGFFYGMLCYAIALVIHILWTFSLIKKNEAFFE